MNDESGRTEPDGMFYHPGRVAEVFLGDEDEDEIYTDACAFATPDGVFIETDVYVGDDCVHFEYSGGFAK